ncbi:MAG: hypothetical protein V1915_05025 [Candidatus Bathyarchaeota archaeon]
MQTFEQNEIVIIISLFTILLISFFTTVPNISRALSPLEEENIEKAVGYLIAMYNPVLGLIANSEDEGPNPLGEAEGVPCNSTYWIYDDNLWAGWALLPFQPNIAENITKTVQHYSSQYGRSMIFEAAIGEPVPTTIHASKNIKVFEGVTNGVHVQVLLDRHQSGDNSGIFSDAQEYEDLCCYMALNYWMMGDANASEYWFRTAEQMWNSSTNKGFYDKAAISEGRYQNFKLGLFLLAQKVTGFQSNVIEEVTRAAWSYQNAMGGITTQSGFDGSLYGTANAEATTALLLVENSQLVGRLRKRQTYAEYMWEVTEAKFTETQKTLQSLSLNNSARLLENKALREFPWGVTPWPSWFTGLLFSTLVFAILSLSLLMQLRKHMKREVNP